MTYESTAEALTEPTVAQAGNPDFAAAAGARREALGGRSVLVCDQESVVAVMHCLDAETITDAGFQQSYPPEAGALAGLNGPHVSVPRGYVVDAGGWIVASIRGHVEGVSLAEALAGRPRGVDVQAAATVAKDVLTALTGLHRSGIAHRRVSADQVIVRTQGLCVLIDAGLAPRETSQGRDGDLAADLAAVAELFADCLDGGRAAGQAGGGAQRARTLPRQAGELAEYLFALLGSPTLDHVPYGERAAGALTALDAVLVQHFGPAWEECGREELAARVDAVRRANFRSNTPTALVEPDVRPGGGLRRGRHATKSAGARHTQRLQRQQPPQRAVRYGGPLFAFTVAFTVVLILVSHASSWAGELQASATPAKAHPGATASSQAAAASASHSPTASPGSGLRSAAGGGHGYFTTASSSRTLRWDDAQPSHRAFGGRGEAR